MFLEQIFRITGQNWSFIIDCRLQQDTAVQTILKICFQCHFSRTKTISSFQSHLSTGLQLFSLFLGGCTGSLIFNSIWILELWFHQSSFERGIWAPKSLGNSRNYLVDSNSAQVLCKYCTESSWKHTLTSFIRGMDPASHHAPCPYLNNSPINLKIEESALVTDLKIDSSVLRTDTNQGHDPVLFQRCLKFGFLLLALNPLFSQGQPSFSADVPLNGTARVSNISPKDGIHHFLCRL